MKAIKFATALVGLAMVAALFLPFYAPNTKIWRFWAGVQPELVILVAAGPLLVLISGLAIKQGHLPRWLAFVMALVSGVVFLDDVRGVHPLVRG